MNHRTLRRLPRLLQWISPALVVMLATLSAWSQSGSISGVVKDPQQAVITGARISLVPISHSSSTSNAITNNHGEYSFTSVPFGSYELHVKADGFNSVRNNVVIDGKQNVMEDIVLTLSAYSESINVRGNPQKAIPSDSIAGLGPLAGGKLQNTPYSIIIVTPELIEGTQATTIDDLVKLNPLAQMNQPQTYGSQSYAMVRGFKVDNFQALEDGLYTSNSLMNLEDKERVEFLNGLAGFVYGPASPGGTFNYVLKRPTLVPYYSLTAGDVTNGSAYLHLDLGGPIYRNKVAYRVNLAGQDGDTAIKYQNIIRDLATGAVDWHVTPNALLSVDYAHDDTRINGTTAKWTFGTTVPYPKAPDTTNLWAQKFGFSTENRNKVGVGFNWKINKILTARGRLARETLTREGIQFTNTVSDSSGSYTETATVWAPWFYHIKAAALAADAQIKTGFLSHTITVAWFGRNIDLKEHVDDVSKISLSGGFNFFRPLYVSNPHATIGVKPVVPSTRTENRNLAFADNVNITHNVSLLAGLTYSNVITRGWKLNSGAISSRYDKSKISPSVSLMYLPKSWLSTYATFTQGLEKGGAASKTDTNANEAMPPMLSKQWEIGIKSTVEKTLFTLALFNINKAYEYDRTNSDLTTTYVQSGREIHRGLEMSASGHPIDHLMVFGGFTLLDPQVQKNLKNPELNGTRPINVSKQVAKLYAEYDIPGLRSLTVTGDVYYGGRMAATTNNAIFVPSITTGDLGARYQFKVRNVPITARYKVTNFTGSSYWLNNSYLGDPRAHSFNLQIRY
jgi:iron complex outermembrane recepter protein